MERFHVKLPLVSIITPTYNTTKYLERTIESVLGQDYPNIEYIMVDGGSTFETLSIIKKYESRIDKWLSETDRGIAHAFNKGVCLCNGEIIGILNSDDWYETDTVSRVVEVMDCGDIFYGDVQYFDQGGPAYLFHSKHELLSRVMSIAHPSVFVKKSVYKNEGLYREEYRLAMDYEFLLRCFVNGLRFIRLEGVLANKQTGGVSDQKWLKAYAEVYCIKKRHLRRRCHFLEIAAYTVRRVTFEIGEKIGLRSAMRLVPSQICFTGRK